MQLRALVIAFIFGLGLVAHSSLADAGKVEKRFGGKILTSDKKFPHSAKSENAYISKLNKQKKIKFWEDKANQQWKIHFAAFFKKPLTDLEYTVKLYDVSNGRQLLSSFEQYTDSSDQTSLLSYIVLERKHFGVNKKIMMTIESKGRVVAAGSFQILGEAEKFTGKADFSEEEAAGGGSEE
jgi:hypothetical protein